MADWSILDRDYSCYDYYPYYHEKEQNAPAQCVQQPYNSPSPTLTLLLSPPPCYQPQKGENPREIRNKAEKQRRDKMNQSVLRLASIVPTVAKPGRKLNKTSVLRLAAHYIRSHQHVFGSSIDRGPEFSLKFTETLLKNLKGFLITTTYKGIVVVVSPNVQEYLGYTELELLGQNVFSIIHKDDHQLLRDQLYPRSCTLTQKGELYIPNDTDAEKNIAVSLANERRSFVVRFRKLSQQKSEPLQYITCHVEGSLRKADHAGSRSEQVVHIGRRARSRGDNSCTSGNDIIFVGMVRPTAETFVTEGVLESFRMEYRTRHSIDGEIIQCEQRIALVTGYMTHEVSGVNAMNFMHRDDVRWVIIALREMYDQHRLVGESCYRLITKNGQFIYMRTLGRLDVDQNSKAVTSFVCTNTVVAEQEGKQLIKLMKKKFTLMINKNEEPKEEEEISEEVEKQTPPVEDPKQLEKVILHLVTDLPSCRSDDRQNQLPFSNGQSSSHLAIIPPRKEKIHEAIEKSYSIIRSCCSTMVGKKRKDNKRNKPPVTPKQTQPKQTQTTNQQSPQGLPIFAQMTKSTRTEQNSLGLPLLGQMTKSTRAEQSPSGLPLPTQMAQFTRAEQSSQSLTSLAQVTIPTRTEQSSFGLNSFAEMANTIDTCINTMPTNSMIVTKTSPSNSSTYSAQSFDYIASGHTSYYVNTWNLPGPSYADNYPIYQNNVYNQYYDIQNVPVTPPPNILFEMFNNQSLVPQNTNPNFLYDNVESLSPVCPLPQPPQPPALPNPRTNPSTPAHSYKGKRTCYHNSNTDVLRAKRICQRKKEAKKETDEHQLPKEIDDLINIQLSNNDILEKSGQLPMPNLLAEEELEKVLDTVEKDDGISSKNYKEIFNSMQNSGKFYEEPSEDSDEKKKAKEGKKKKPHDVYEFKNNLKDHE